MKFLLFIACILPIVGLSQQSSRMVAESSYLYNDAASVYELSDTTAYYYHSGRGGDPSTLRPHLFDSSLSWRTDNTTPLEYRSRQVQLINGNSVVRELYNRDNVNNLWKPSTMDTITYDTDGNMLRDFSQVWVSNAWVAYGLTTATYNTNNDILSLLTLQYNSSLNVWDSVTKIHKVYSGKKTDTSITQDVFTTGWLYPSLTLGDHVSATKSIYLFLTKTANGWDSISRNYATYDNNGYPIADSFVSKSQQSGTWAVSSANHHTYDSNGDMIETIRMTYDASLGKLVNSSKTISTYNNFRQRTSVTFLRWDKVTSQWQPGFGGAKNNYYYETYTTGIAGVSTAKAVRLYPNPASNYIIVEGAGQAPYRIMNLAGQTVRTGVTSDMIHINDLAAGQYLIGFGSGEMHRFIKQ